MSVTNMRIVAMELVTDFFSTGDLIGGLTQNDFDVSIYDPNGLNRADGTNAVDWSIAETFSGSGYYTIEFTPDLEGDWVVSVIHNDYFPWGKSAGYRVITSVSTDDLLAFILGLY